MSVPVSISGFTMVKNAGKLYYPIRQSIESILPIVDEFVVALGDCDEDDDTEQQILSIGSDKIRIIHTVWDTQKFPNGTENAHQTDIAREACKGDWLFYIQADEVVHEKDHGAIVKRCHELKDDPEVEGLLFKYLHFWGDYDHHQVAHGWYPREIRIVRNHQDIHSWGDAQSFRRIPDFHDSSYGKQEGTYKLKVAAVDAHIYHYGWVRPPQYMQNKRKALDTIYKGSQKVSEIYAGQRDEFDYGPMKLTKTFKGTHPAVMKEWMEKFNWGEKLYRRGPIPTNRHPFKHEKLKYRILTAVEQNLLGGRSLGGFNNYILLKK